MREEGNEEILGPEVPYLSAIGALMYLAIAFAVNLLARYGSSPTQRHWNGVKHVLRYLKGSLDIGLFYTNENKLDLIGYADAGFRSDPHVGRSQTGYLFTCGGTAISWRSMKQTISATSSNHAEILAMHEASRECVWLRSLIHHVRTTCGITSSKMSPQSYMRIILHVFLNSKKTIYKETERSTFHQSSSSLNIFRKMVKLISTEIVKRGR